MASINCEACDELRTTAPGLVVNGLDDTMCASLQNNTGLSPSSGNNDCTDLNNMNDCLVGNMAAEIEAYDVCDWKTFMKKFIPNVWTTIKGVVCAICGLWANITDINDKLDALCEQSTYTYAPPVARYGSLPNASTAARRCGTIAQKNGQPLLVPYTYQEVVDAGLTSIWEYQDVGVAYGRIQTESCSTKACQLYEWIAPSLLMYRIHSSARSGDILWTMTKEEAINVVGMSERLWDIFSTVGYTWKDYPLGDRRNAYVRLVCEKNGESDQTFVMQFMGTTYPNNNLESTMSIEEPEAPYRLYTVPC